MQIINELNPTTAFTRIPNEVIFDQNLTPAEFRLWVQLCAITKGSHVTAIDTAALLAAECGIDKDSCRDRRRSLRDKGYIENRGRNIVVTLPGEGFKPKPAKVSKEQQLRMDLRDVWNKHKPETYSKLRNPVSEAQVRTMQLHADHNEQTDLPKFLAAVLKGCKADSWWSDKNLNVGNVFGNGVPKQNKFTNVEKLFKLAGSTKGQAALFDVQDDQCWLDWFTSKGKGEFQRVERLTMGRQEAWKHQMANEGDNVLYVYHDEERHLVHWTYKENSVGVSYLPTA